MLKHYVVSCVPTSFSLSVYQNLVINFTQLALLVIIKLIIEICCIPQVAVFFKNYSHTHTVCHSSALTHPTKRTLSIMLYTYSANVLTCLVHYRALYNLIFLCTIESRFARMHHAFSIVCVEQRSIISTRLALKVAPVSTPREAARKEKRRKTKKRTEEKDAKSVRVAGLREFLDARSSDKLGS